MFFDAKSLPSRKKSIIRQMPAIPDTGWKRPEYFPNLIGNVKAISIDTETWEPEFDKGPGWSRGVGHIVGFSVGVIGHDNKRDSWYFPVRHEVEPEDNINPEAAFDWLRNLLEGTPLIPKIGANLIYDYGWLTEENIFMKGPLHDVQFAEAILNESGLVNLDFLGKKYLNEGKTTNHLYDWCADYYGGKPTGTQRANIYRAPARLVGHYAEGDADLPLQIIEKQFPLMLAENLMEVYDLESRGIRLYVEQRRTGVNIDIDGAEKLHTSLAVEIEQHYQKLYQQTGIRASVDSPKDLVKIFDSQGLKYPFTDAGNPSFTAKFLEAVDHPVAQTIRDIRERVKIRGTFIESYLLNSHVNGRVHCQFHPLRNDKNGTVTGRDASSNPNFQNVPVRSELGKSVRKLFIPDEGHLCWNKKDYSQLEYRLLAHFAVGLGSDELRQSYIDDPKTDYHDRAKAMIDKATGKNYERKPIKTINFGLLYGMGKDKLGDDLHLTKKETNELFDIYHSSAPYVKATMEAFSKEAEQLGYITTILNRRRRFEEWEPASFKGGKKKDRPQPLNYYAAIKKYGSQIKRAFTYIATNTRLQGSAGDTFKMAMVKCYEAGVFDVIGVPKIRVHDEADNSVIDDSPEQNEGHKEMIHIMENAIKLRVPLIVDSGRGATWGDVD